MSRFLVCALLCAAISSGQENAERLPPPDDLQARQLGFEQRSSAPNLEKLGREFFALTFLKDWNSKEFNRPDRWKLLGEVRARLDAGDYPAALDGFKAYTLRKLRYADSYGLTRAVNPYGSPDPIGRSWLKPLLTSGQESKVLAQAQDLMNNVITAGKKRIHIGQPGTVNWKQASLYTFDEVGVPKAIWDNWPWHLAAFSPLLDAYLLTGEKAYISKWAEFADDWAMNQNYSVGTVEAYNIPDTWSGGAESTFTFIRYLAGIALERSASNDLPSATFARVMGRLVRDYLPLTRMYHRSNPQNWTEHSIASLFENAFLLDEYHFAPLYLREARRRLELLVPTRHMPDGTDSELNVGYDFGYLTAASTAVDLWKLRTSRVPAWMAPEWERPQREQLKTEVWERELSEVKLRRARFLAGHLMPSGEWPIGGARADHRNRADQSREMFLQYVPEAFAQPDISRILEITRTHKGEDPSFTSEWFPYAGYRYIRAGWKAQDPYLFMISSPKPLLGNLSAQDNNAIGLAGYGMDLLMTGDVGPYSRNRSPILVDGKEQFFHAGIPLWGHRHFLVAANYEPAPCRWHDSSHFTISEGIYDGPYGGTRSQTPEEQANANRAALRGVTHRRLVHYVRDAGIWIITDRMFSAQEHEYTQDWRMPLQPSRYPAFSPGQISVEPQRMTIKTASPATPNISLYQFASQALRYGTKVESIDAKAGYRLCDFFRVSASWKARGTSTVVTAIYPRPTLQDEVASIKPLGADGFEAETPAGHRVLYQAAANTPGKLSLGGVTISGEALLLVMYAPGTARGVALGCTEMAINGKAQKVSATDFEFEVIQGRVQEITPIYTPLAPVQISPQTDLFVGEQSIALSSATPNVQIRYTLDGTEPGLDSPLYKEPFTITRSVVLKARALRSGLIKLPETLSGTHATPVSSAVFNKAEPLKPAADLGLEPGLDYSYYDGRWQDLFMDLGQLKPKKRGGTGALFDLSPRENTGPYAIKYDGYLEVPVDGTYTFHAPPESYLPNIVAGYELRVLVAGQEWYPSTRVHALGTWSIALMKGRHPFSVSFADFRREAAQRVNQAGLARYIWDGIAPDLRISGPGLEKQSIPASLLRRPRK